MAAGVHHCTLSLYHARTINVKNKTRSIREDVLTSTDLKDFLREGLHAHRAFEDGEDRLELLQ